jgi:hypothetical protein
LYAARPEQDLVRLRPLTWSLDIIELHGVQDADAAIEAIGPDPETDLQIHS